MLQKLWCVFLGIIIFVSVVYSEQGSKALQGSSGRYYDTLYGTVMCGYQGWFRCPEDGSGRGWVHWGMGAEFEQGKCTIDLWPDMSEFGDDEKYATDFVHADGSSAYVFSSNNSKTVGRHFKWMQEYGIDGVFLQRFATEVSPSFRHHRDSITLMCQEHANTYKRGWAMMYDLSGLGKGGTESVIEDWKHLVGDLGITKDARDRSYIYHKEKPVVAVWGVGFSDNRKYTLEDCEKLIDFLKNDPVYGGNTVVLGVPSYWLRGVSDSVGEPYRLKVMAKADIISPWSVGRFGSENKAGLDNYVENVWKPDMKWCDKRGIDYLPVVFPGFSWYNMHNGKSKLDQIPRLKGEFLWRQYHKAIDEAGAKMVYQAMFDEVDEATAIIKCTNNPPAGESKFLTYEGLPADHYLWLVGQATRMLRDEIPLTDLIPKREP